MEQDEDPGSRRGARIPCAGCPPISRRRMLGQVSVAALAAMAGVELAEGGGGTLPVIEVSGEASGNSERSYPMPAADGVTIDHDEQVIVVRFQRHAYAFNLACPHENTALRWRQQDGRFQCPRHDSKYRPDGTFMEGRATRNMDRFAVKRVGDRLVVDLDRLFQSDRQPQDWAAATIEL